jgi:hypothetical protein
MTTPAEVPVAGAPDKPEPAPQNPDSRVTMGEVFGMVAQFSAAHPDLTPDLAYALKQAVVELENRSQ